MLRSCWCGTAIQDLLRQTCSVNFQGLSLAENPVILTLMVGVSVTIIPIATDRYRIWCDGTFGAYLWETLVTIAQELGRGSSRCRSLDLSSDSFLEEDNHDTSRSNPILAAHQIKFVLAQFVDMHGTAKTKAGSCLTF